MNGLGRYIYQNQGGRSGRALWINRLEGGKYIGTMEGGSDGVLWTNGLANL